MRPYSLTVLPAILLPLFMAPLSGSAQESPLNSQVSITKIEPAFLDSPKINAGSYNKKATGRPSPWLEVEVTFDRASNPKLPKYADELTFNYYILLKNDHLSKDKKPTLLTGSVTHVLIPEEKQLHASAYVSPRALASFFDGKTPVNAQQAIVDLGVTVSGKDGLLAISTLKGTVKGDKGWWDDTTSFTVAPGFILNKTETPFAPLEWDYYEAIKSKSGN